MVSGCHAFQQTLQGCARERAKQQVGNKEKPISPPAHSCCALSSSGVLLPEVCCPNSSQNSAGSENFAKTTDTVVNFFNGEHTAAISKSKAKLCSKNEWKPKFISLHFPASIKKLCLSTYHCLACKLPGNALQWKDTCFRRICWKLFTKLFSMYCWFLRTR